MSEDDRRAIRFEQRTIPVDTFRGEPDSFLGTLIQQHVRDRITEGAKP